MARGRGGPQGAWQSKKVWQSRGGVAVPRSMAPGGVAASRGRGWEGSWLQTRQASPTFVDTLAGVLGEMGHQGNVRVEPGPPFSGLPPLPTCP